MTNPTIPGLGPSQYQTQSANQTWSLTQAGPAGMRFEVRHGDKWSVDVTNGELDNRSEVQVYQTYNQGSILGIAYDFKLDPGPTNTSAWMVMGQVHETPGPGAGTSPLFSTGLHYQSDLDQVNINYRKHDGSEAFQTLWTDSTPLVRGQSYRKIFKLWPDLTKGRLVYWRDGVKLVDYEGPLGFGLPFFFKFGVYRGSQTGWAPTDPDVMETMAATYSNLLLRQI